MQTATHLSHVAGMVTVYNSADTMLTNVQSYVHQVGKLYVVDNSEVRNDRLVARLTGLSATVTYLRNDSNAGLGEALNRAARQALADGFTHLLMMDDDSSLSPEAVARLYETASAAPAVPIGIVSADQVGESDSGQPASVRRPGAAAAMPTVVLTAITAGSLLSLTAYERAGPFQDDLFIDWVDIEYGFRLRKHGYQLLLDRQVRMVHRIGITQQTRLLGLIPYRWRSHSPVRLYYKFRNSLYVMAREGDAIPADFRRRFRRELRRNVIKILLAEPNKGEFFALIRKAVNDARAGRLGKLT